MILVEGLKAFLAAELPPRTQQAIDQHRRRLRARRFSVRNRGDTYLCNFCNRSHARFMPSGLNYPVIKEKKIVAAGLRENVLCPGCGSMDRERLARLVLEDHIGLKPHHDVLHVAPEGQLFAHLAASQTGRLIPCDLNPEDRSDVQGVIKQDLTNLDFADGDFDVVICNHVLEHIPADDIAMAEIGRVLKAGGKGLLQVPYSEIIEATEEDFSVITNAERVARYGQADHVRVYHKQDYVRRLEAAGFTVEVVEPEALEVYRHFAINPNECAFIVSKPQ